MTRVPARLRIAAAWLCGMVLVASCTSHQGGATSSDKLSTSQTTMIGAPTPAPAAAESQAKIDISTGPGSAMTETPTSGNATLPAGDVQTLEHGLAATEVSQVQAVLAPAVAAEFAKHPIVLLPPGSRVTVDPTSLVVDGDLAAVSATVNGPAPGSWLLLLVRQNGRWLVYGTRAQ